MITSETTFTKAAEVLLMDYSSIYCVDLKTNKYRRYSFDENTHALKTDLEDSDFFRNVSRDNARVVFKDDEHIFTNDFNREKLLNSLKGQELGSIEYRLMIDGQPVWHSLRLITISEDEGSDEEYMILGVKNIDTEVQKRQAAAQREQEQTRNLQQANAMARTDELTGVKNKTAFGESQKSIQSKLDKDANYPFACIVCDMNDLKDINDTQGHSKGDEYLIRSAEMICMVFQHSPVFRIGGDEFAVILTRHDYADRDVLLERFRKRVHDNMRRQEGPVVASGMAVYDPDIHDSVMAVMEQADRAMYDNKKRLKEGILEGDEYGRVVDRIIPESRRQALDQLFDAFAMAAEGATVFVCDMRHDYSRWSKVAVEIFGLPAEYMYGAGYICEQHIHPEDRDAYHDGVDAVFFGSNSQHNMKYRARNAKGEYVECFCKGIVIRDRSGDAEYFCGTIRNQGVQDNIDAATGLHNQYEFLENLQTDLAQKNDLKVWIVGVSRFSEINDIYGYRSGNILLRNIGEFLCDQPGDAKVAYRADSANYANVYRLDGPKFGVICSDISEDEIRSLYDKLRRHFREFELDGKPVSLKLNAGLLSSDNSDIDERTAFSCLEYAYKESKHRRQGDLVKFHNGRNDENQEWIERIHAIRASITEHYKGFFLTYQPMVDAKSGDLMGAEALLRWQSDKYGLVPPGEFIPVIEQDPLFPGLSRWILKKAVTDMKPLLKLYPEFSLDVNMAYTQLARPGFADEILTILRDVGYPPQNLCLEFTEQCRLLDMDLLNDVVAKLHSSGIRIALDDFGTDSSISFIENLPLDYIKIDRSFIRGIEENVRDRELLNDFTSAAVTHDTDVCIQGVENESMAELLWTYPVRSFQGYLFSRPLEYDDFRRWARKWEIERAK